MKTPSVIGHRGACGHAPENTLASFRKAKALGAEWVEFDTMLSADNQVVIFHDETLERTTGALGRVAECNWKKLRTLDVGRWFSDQYAGEGIPLLSTVIEELEVLGLGAVIEIKPSQGQDAETARLSAEIVRDKWPQSLPVPILSSFSETALEVAHDLAPEIPKALNVSEVPDNWQKTVMTLGCGALHCQHENLNRSDAGAILAAGYDLRCFTINEPKTAESIFRWGAASIFTDFPDRFV